MPNILETLGESARLRVEEARRETPLEALREQARSLPRGAAAFERALMGADLAGDSLHFIC